MSMKSTLTALLLTTAVASPAFAENAKVVFGTNWLAQAEHGGDLMRIEIANAKPLGRKRGWATAYPVVQWSLAR